MAGIIKWIFSLFETKPSFLDMPIQIDDIGETKDGDELPQIELTEFEKIKAKFNERTDVLVISENYALSDSNKAWIDTLGNKVIYFKGNYLINIGVVTSGF